MTKVSKFHFWSLIWARQFLQASLIWAGQFLQACGLKNQNRDLQKLPNMQINHNNPSLTSLQIEPSTQGPLVPSLSPLGFWTLWALALLLYLRARACAQKVGGGGGSSYTGCARKPFFGLNMDELDARIWGIISKSYGGLIQNPTCPTARVNLMLALSGTWCSMWLAILRTFCRGHPARLGPVLGSCRIWQFLVGWSFELIHFLKHETIFTRIKPTIFLLEH